MSARPVAAPGVPPDIGRAAADPRRREAAPAAGRRRPPPPRSRRVPPFFAVRCVVRVGHAFGTSLVRAFYYHCSFVLHISVLYNGVKFLYAVIIWWQTVRGWSGESCCDVRLVRAWRTPRPFACYSLHPVMVCEWLFGLRWTLVQCGGVPWSAMLCISAMRCIKGLMLAVCLHVL